MAITIKNIVESTLQNSKHTYSIGRTTPAFTKFIVECGSVKLYGKVSANAYETQTKKLDGTVLDEVNCTIKNTDDIINRINESINTASKLSKYVKAMTEARKDYLTPGFVTEADDDDDDEDKQLLLDGEEDTKSTTAEPEKNLETSINAFYAGIISMADEALELASSSETSEVAPDIMTDIIGYSAALYGLADDVNDTIEDLFPAPETETESVERKHKKSDNEKLINEVVGKLSEISLMLKDNKDMQDIREAVKLIKSQLIVD
jgi:hypothetical protein